MKLTRRHVIVAAITVSALGAVPAVALASPGSGFHPKNLVTAHLDSSVHLNSDRVKFQTKDAVDVRVQELVLDAGSYSGWHHHPGMVIVAVKTGSVTFTDSHCVAETHAAGTVFIEGGEEPGQASSVGGALLYVTFVAPRGDPTVFRSEDAPITCP